MNISLNKTENFSSKKIDEKNLETNLSNQIKNQLKNTNQIKTIQLKKLIMKMKNLKLKLQVFKI